MDAVRVLEKHGINVTQGPDDWLILTPVPDVLLPLPIGLAAVLSRDMLDYICELIPEIGIEEFYTKPLPLN
ncbi:hypothetical protein [Candidatus Binatus sp.]|uniref:hypothetical protein n=1 Tax=Candidatus Binatus sp. TaxID=2811406 RepID=UPI003C579035